MKNFKIILLLLITTTFFACGNYSFTGASIASDVKSFQVNYFQNNAILVEPGLNRDFTIALQDLITNQTNLSLVNSNADLVYEGEIVEYRISPTTATSQNTAAQNRLTIGINVRFFNKKTKKTILSNVSLFYDYGGSEQLVGSIKATAFEEIFERLTQDIFNASLAKW